MSDFNFEQAMKRIEEIVKILEDDNIELEKSLQLYQEGVTLSNECYKKLNEVEKQSIKILDESDINKLKEDNNNE